MSLLEGEWGETKALSRRDARHPVVVDHVQRRIQWVHKHLHLEGNNTCLELGAGDGFFSMTLQEHFDLKVSDFSAPMLKKNPFNGEKLVIDARDISFPANSFDVVFEANILHHIENDRKVAEEMVRVSSSFIVVLEPNRLNPLNFILGLVKPEERKSLKFSRRYVRKLFTGLNVELVSDTSFGLVPANKCPVFLWKILRFFDQVIPLFGLENIFIFKKKQNL